MMAGVVIAPAPLRHDARGRDVPINHAVVGDVERDERLSPLKM